MLKRYTYFIGYSVTICSLVYVGVSIWQNAGDLFQEENIISIWVCLIGGSIIYAGTTVLILLAWHHMVYFLDDSATISNSYFVYARSQIAKYFPGNVFHYAGRQVLGRERGLSHITVGVASYYETVLISATAFGIAVLGIPNLSLSYGTKMALFLVGSVALGLLILGILLFRFLPSIAPFIAGRIEKSANLTISQWIWFMVVPILLYVLFFVGVGVVIWTTAVFSFPTVELSYSLSFVFTTVYTASWVIGYVTPGAPGGLGVRETILFTGLTPYLGQAQSLTLALILRMITTLGDVIVYLTSYFVHKKRS